MSGIKFATRKMIAAVTSVVFDFSQRQAFKCATAFLCAIFVSLSLCSAGAASPAIQLFVVSSRPDMVSGGDALIRVNSAAGHVIRVTLNGHDVTIALKSQSPGVLLGVVSGLRPGNNALVATDGKQTSSRTLKNHPIEGPLFSGPREQPFFCMTEKFALPASKQTLGPALDANCSVATRVDYVYRGSDGAFHPWPSGTDRPAGLVQTTTSDGKTVPYIVRVETGTIDRAIYQVAVLSDPALHETPTPFAQPAAWNRRLVYTFGGGCLGGWHIQGASVGNRSILEDLMLARGYAVASSSLNVFGNNCNMVLAAEALSMVKEHFVKQFGSPDFTIGYGCSGGSEQLQPLTDAYPGLIDGMIVGCSFADVVTAQVINLTDADLLDHYFKSTGLPWSDAQKLAASGYPTVTTLPRLGEDGGRIKPKDSNCNAAIPPADRFSAANPKGIRCDVYDHDVNIFGRDASSGRVRRPWDNVGVEYGLTALNDGAISKEQFIDLNRTVGGYGDDGQYVAARSQGDLSAIAAAYGTGQVTYGGHGLRHVPIIDYRGYVDQPENAGEVHSRFHSFVMRARLEQANGTAANQVMLIEAGGAGTTGLFGDDSPVLSHAVTQMDQWLTKLKSGSDAEPSPQQISDSKPGDLQDACFTENGKTKIAETQVWRGATACNRLYPAFATPRIVAGEPLAYNVLKCRVKPFDPRDYGVTFTPAEIAQLKSIFPGGVCNYAVPGIGQAPAKSTWVSFK